jgi:isoquinoline 1-oxidoreductase subunit beta
MNIQKKIANNETRGVSRRDFLVGSAAGLGLVMGYGALPVGGGVKEAMAAGSFSPNMWFSMDDAGITTVNIVKAEMGQHVGTAIAQSLADELEVPWENIRLNFPDVAPQWGLFITGGSWSINWTFAAMSQAGAAGRIVLMEQAVKNWGVPVAELRADQGMIYHDKSSRKVSYGDLVKGCIVSRSFNKAQLEAIKLKAPQDRKVIGKSVANLDIPGKTNGSTKYGIDTFIDGMVYGAPRTPPVRYGATVKNVDDSAAKKIAGYQGHVVLEDPTKMVTGWIVALADSYPAALKASAALEVDYDLGPNAKVSSESIMKEAQEMINAGEGGKTFVDDGDVKKGMAAATAKFTADYTTSLNLHMPLEPMNATVWEEDDIWHVTTGNQFQTVLAGVLPIVLGVDPSAIVIKQTALGGGFGRRLEADYVVVAALAAKGAKKPVKMIYDRAADTQFDFPRSQVLQSLKAGIKDGKLDSMTHDAVCTWATSRLAPAFLADAPEGKIDYFAINGADFWYSVPNHRVRVAKSKLGDAAAPAGNLRSVAPGYTFFAVESFMDELAHELKIDPLAFRMSMLDAAGKQAGSAPMSVGGAKRLAGVLKAATDKAEWGKKMAEGSGMGLSISSAQERATPTWTACVVEVDVDKSNGNYKVKKMTIAIDVGTAVNPDAVKAQVEGSALWGLSIATKEEATMEDGAIQQTNFDTYDVLRMEDVPEMDVIVLSPGEYPVGCGEPGVTVVAPAIANAIFNATGVRVRHLPMTPEAIKEALTG